MTVFKEPLDALRMILARHDAGGAPSRACIGLSPVRPALAARLCLAAAVLCCLLISLLPFRAPVADAMIDPHRAAKVKAAALKEVIRYTRWPAEAFADEDGPIEVLMIGRNDLMERYLGEVLRGATAHDRRIIFQRIELPAGRPGPPMDARIRRSHVVFVAESGYEHLQLLLDARNGSHVLMVSEVPAFTRSGGMIGLLIQEGRLVIEANPVAIEKTGITLSSHVLRLARIISTMEKLPSS